MATYVIGDVQGCFDSLQALLSRVAFSTEDRLWLVGDLVNRGPKSLEVLRFLRSLGHRVTAVLGNHDLHLLARWEGVIGPKARDTLGPLLAAPDAAELLAWLAARPLLHREGGERGWVMVHAGLSPFWTLGEAELQARRLEAIIRDPRSRRALLAQAAFPFELKILTTIRTCHADGSLCKWSGSARDAPPGCLPWYAHPERRSRGQRIVFGHWAALGLTRGEDFVALDSGCVWGGSLTAFRLEDEAVFQVPSLERTLGGTGGDRAPPR